MARRRTQKTPEQRKAEAEALHQTFVEKVATLTDSEEWMKFLTAAATFHQYSAGNLMLILAQCPHATQVAGFRQWQAHGRQVRKGERAMKIRGFSTKKVTETDDNGDETEKKVARFPILSVFDVSQTDPIEGAEVIEHPAHQLTGTDDAGLYEAVAAHLERHSIPVERKPLAAANGYTTQTDNGIRVVVGEGLTPAQAAKTIAHEAAHVDLGHVEADYSEYLTHRGRFETEAESVAHVIAGMAGMDTTDYSVGYVATWAKGDLDLIAQTATRVLASVHRLAQSLWPTENDTTEGAADNPAA
jgi:antirestriction protein ArdC